MSEEIPVAVFQQEVERNTSTIRTLQKLAGRLCEGPVRKMYWGFAQSPQLLERVKALLPSSDSDLYLDFIEPGLPPEDGILPIPLKERKEERKDALLLILGPDAEAERMEHLLEKTGLQRDKDVFPVLDLLDLQEMQR